MLDFRYYIWRGHRCDDWFLEPTLDRRLKRVGRVRQRQLRKSHLENFQYAVRGRRGPNPVPISNENDWWALGQHHGLDTPLLDWTSSPFAAAYFAFFHTGPDQTRRRALYAVNSSALEAKSREIAKSIEGPDRPPIVELVRPQSDDNPRLVNQAGLFTRAPDRVDLESWIKKHFAGIEDEYILIKITIPNKDRQMALRSLNRMNINHLTLFPDLHGASRFCNLDLDIDKY
ncbi:MAG: FRG domain-containing protein [Proteobacteria bacterium]|nr:FRG domain-containing protein [Pseudomonadota bacterium]